ncbi:MAG: hypothetical protein AAGG50_16330 [Bacteroidota bacterium]
MASFFAALFGFRQPSDVTWEHARARATRGAAYLDGADPGWWSRLDATTLELADGRACVLGQLHGEFRQGLSRARILDLSSAPLASLSPVDLGFQAYRRFGDATEALDYAYLTRAWREEIAARTPPKPTALSPRVRQTA